MSAQSRYSALCQRIIEHCRQQRWYGPDDGMEDERYVVGIDGTLQRRSTAHDLRTSFEFAPATPEQVQATEQALGFALPPLLRTLYTQVANGGFGPGAGLTGIRDGYVYGQDGRYITLDRTEPPSWVTQALDLGEHDALNSGLQRYTLPPRTWPHHFLHLCYWGCETDSYLDAVTGHVYFVGGAAAPYTTILQRQEESLEQWLETWLQGRWRDWFGDPLAQDIPF